MFVFDNFESRRFLKNKIELLKKNVLKNLHLETLIKYLNSGLSMLVVYLLSFSIITFSPIFFIYFHTFIFILYFNLVYILYAIFS